MKSIKPDKDTVYLHSIADRLLEWAKQSDSVLAWFWYGSFARGQETQGSDLDAAVLLKPGTDVATIRQALASHLADQMKLSLDHADPQRVICYLGDKYLKVECALALNPEDLACLVDAEDVPAPRLALAFELDGEPVTALCFSGDTRGRESSGLYARFQRLPIPGASGAVGGAAAGSP